jgi:hypothetical protein
MRPRTTRVAGVVGAAVVASVLVTVAAVGGAAFGSPTRGNASPQVSTTQFTCSEGGTVIGGGVLTMREHVVGGRLTGWMVFDADNGVTKRYVEHAVVTYGDVGDTYVDGTFVTQGAPLYSDWLFINGSAVYAPSGILGSYTGTAVDVCHELGY